MAKISKLEELFGNSRDSLSEYFPWRMWDETNQCFDNSDKTIGWLWELQPLAFAGESTMKNMEILLNLDLPENSVIQFILFADPRVEAVLHMVSTKGAYGFEANYMQLTREWMRRYTTYLNEHTKIGFDESVPVPVRNYRLFLAIKIPYTEYQTTIDKYKDRRDAVTGLLSSSGFHPEVGNVGCLLDLVRYCYNPGFHFRNQEHRPYNHSMWIHRQVVLKTTDIQWLKGPGGGLTIDGKSVGVYSVAGYPNELDLYDNLFLLGNIFSRNLEQILLCFLFCEH